MAKVRKYKIMKFKMGTVHNYNNCCLTPCPHNILHRDLTRKVNSFACTEKCEFFRGMYGEDKLKCSYGVNKAKD